MFPFLFFTFFLPFVEEFIWNLLRFFLQEGVFVMHPWGICLGVVRVFMELVVLVMGR